MDIKAIIFDMDGVLIDAKDWHYEALNRALGMFGMEISRYDHLVTYDGLPTRVKLEMLTKERGLPISLHEFVHEMKQKYTMELVYSLCKPQFHHEYALSRLKKDGYKIGLASNSIRETVDAMMHKSSLEKYLDVCFSNEDVKCAKPSPEIYLKAMDALSVRPKDCLILEDNENGLRAANDSGAHVMRVRRVEDVTYSNIIDFMKKLGHENA